MHFQTRCRLKFFLPYGPMLPKNGKNPKFEIRQSYATLVENLPMSMHEFLVVNLLCTFRGDLV